MKSARLVESFAWQAGLALDEIRQVEFRHKDILRPASTYTAAFVLNDGRTVLKDWTEMADGDWSAGFFQNSACDFCDDVVAETADISFGDAWLEPYSSDGRGTNVVIARSRTLHEVLKAGIAENRLDLRPVGAEFVEQTQARGFRQRREGLAYRLCWRRAGIRPRKRVDPDACAVSLRRKMIYRMRSFISRWSHRIGWLAAVTRWRALYAGWARAVARLYAACAWSQGRLCRMLDRWGLP